MLEKLEILSTIVNKKILRIVNKSYYIFKKVSYIINHKINKIFMYIIFFKKTTYLVLLECNIFKYYY